MENGIPEEDQIHSLSRVVNVMFTQILSKFLGQKIKIINSKIFLLSIIIISKNSLLDLSSLPLQLETILQIALQDSEEPSSIFIVNQPVVEDTLSLMNP